MSDAKVEQRHRDRAKQFVHDYSVRDCFGAREAPIEELAQDYANAEAAGYAAGVKDEREAHRPLVEAVDAFMHPHRTGCSLEDLRAGVMDCAASQPDDNAVKDTLAMIDALAAIRARSDASLSPRKRGSDAQEVKP